MLKIVGNFFQGLSSKTSELQPNIVKILRTVTQRNRDHTGQYFNAQNIFVETPSGSFPGSDAFVGGVLLLDGRAFCVPSNSTTARIFSGSFSKQVNRFQFPINVMLSSFLNKL